MKRSKEFRKLQQKVMTYLRRDLQLDDNKSTLLMIDYINLSRELKSKLDRLAEVIENEIVSGNEAENIENDL